MDFDDLFMLSIVGVVIIIVIGLVGSIGVSIVGLPINTGSGTQVGYISAIEKGGVLFKTGRVYIKPSLQSTQEDKYCVIDDSVYSQLNDLSGKGIHVKISYYSVFAAGISKCDMEDAIVSSVSQIN